MGQVEPNEIADLDGVDVMNLLLNVEIGSSQRVFVERSVEDTARHKPNMTF